MSEITEIRKFFHPIFVEAGFAGKPGVWLLERADLTWVVNLERSPRRIISMIAGLKIAGVAFGAAATSANDSGVVVHLEDIAVVRALDGNAVLRALNGFDRDDEECTQILSMAGREASSFLASLDTIPAVRDALVRGEFDRSLVHNEVREFLSAMH